jgi:hypothetical protein
MDIDHEDETAFVHAGTVRWDPVVAKPVWIWKPSVPDGFVVYLMVVNREVRKAGKAEDTAKSTFRRRVEDEFRAVGQVIRGPLPGRPLPKWRTRKLDPFKQHASPVLLAGHHVDVYARSFATREEMKHEEDRLNEKYRGDWTDQGWTRNGQRRLPGSGAA